MFYGSTRHPRWPATGLNWPVADYIQEIDPESAGLPSKFCGRCVRSWPSPTDSISNYKLLNSQW